MRKLIAVSALTLIATAVRADEGMWTFNNFPADKVRAAHGFKPDAKWLEHARLSSVRLAGGCSGSFVSAQGLVLTNHHCAHSCIEQLSTKTKDYVKDGFYAKTLADEKKCPEIEINQLVEITDVTARVRKATQGLSDAKANEAQKAEMSRIEKECQSSARLRCDVVTLYHGGVYNLYKYRRFQDVRLVFAPEFAIAFFGGDPDNFMFPRYDLDMSLLRVYEDGRPARLAHFFPWSPRGARDGELTFVTGHPGRTARQLTVPQLEYMRDVELPERLTRIAERRGMLGEFQRRGAEQKRISNEELFGSENAFKAIKGRYEALVDKRFFATKIAEERALQARIAGDPERRRRYGGALAAIARAVERQRQLRKPYRQLENAGGFMSPTGAAFSSTLFEIAHALVRGAAERPKPSDKRLREYRDSALPALTQLLFSRAPIHDELEILNLSFSLRKMREELGPDDPIVHKVLGKQSPEELAAQLVHGTKLKEVALRQRLWEGGQSAIAASTDAMIAFARRVDPDARAVRKRFEDEVESVIKRNAELLARARFEVQGTSTYPDATFTLRITYGQVKGYREDGREVKPITTFAGAFLRHTGRSPFELPKSWLQAKGKLDLATPFNLCTTNDIIGGNSGSPVINKAGQIVGLIFDGNIQSLGGDFGFDPAVNRAVAVHSEAILVALKRIYGAERLAKELRP
jgi:hypothetical protein